MAVAQLVESRIVIPVVVGSSPISHPKSIKHLARFPGLFALCGCLPVRNLYPDDLDLLAQPNVAYPSCITRMNLEYALEHPEIATKLMPRMKQVAHRR